MNPYGYSFVFRCMICLWRNGGKELTCDSAEPSSRNVSNVGGRIEHLHLEEAVGAGGGCHVEHEPGAVDVLAAVEVTRGRRIDRQAFQVCPIVELVFEAI